MKICHVITTIERGGAENQLLILCKEQRLLGYEIKVIFLKGKPDLLGSLENVGVEVARLSPPIFLLQPLAFWKILRSNNFSLVHAHLPRAELIASLVTLNVPLVITRHNAEMFAVRFGRKISKYLSRFCVWRSSAIIAITNHVKDFLIELEELDSTDKISVVHYGYEFSQLPPSRTKSLNSITEYLSVGRLVSQKDYPTTLLAFSKLLKGGLCFRLTILGEGNLETKLKALSRTIGLERSVNWGGKVFDVEKYFDSSDFLILSSVYEGFGLVLLEAMNWELPIICSNIPTSREILGEDYQGFYEVGNPDSLAMKLIEALDIKEILQSQMSTRKGLFASSLMSQNIQNLYYEVLDINKY